MSVMGTVHIEQCPPWAASACHIANIFTLSVGKAEQHPLSQGLTWATQAAALFSRAPCLAISLSALSTATISAPKQIEPKDVVVARLP
jgi:hypothetical protein